MTQPAPLQATALNATHRRMGAKMVDFGGWDMPLQYSGILEEHRAVRSAAGLFDVSHMGEIEIQGPDAGIFTDYVTTNAVAKLQPGQAQYSGLLYEHAGFVDDILVHKIANDHYFLCVNASNQQKDYQHIASVNQLHASVDLTSASVDLTSDRYTQLAIQGPRALEILQKLTADDLAAIRYYHFIDGLISEIPARIARTGYTGEDGFEIYFAPEHSERVWTHILNAGQEFAIKPCGLGARNTLRLEAGMALYGHEIHSTITPFEAGLDWIVKLNKGDFIGRAALARQKEQGVTHKLIGFEMTGRGIGRDDYEIFVDGVPAGWISSGGPSPTLNKNIGMCYLPSDRAQPGQRIQVMIRGQAADAVTVPMPFYKRAT
ncbi:MAG: glycine cleavage system aminomethyltransferase GcvT [Bryobacteraceae bacterium]